MLHSILRQIRSQKTQTQDKNKAKGEIHLEN